MRTQIATLAWAIITFFAHPQCVQAQETIEQYSQKLSSGELACADFSRPISILDDQNGKCTFVFTDVAKGIIIKAIDIKENNPFTGIGKKTNHPTKDIFIPENKRFKDLFTNFQPEKDSTFCLPADTSIIHKIRMRYSADASKSRQYAVLAYILIADEYVCRTMFIIYDSTGTELNRFVIDNIVGEPVITENGQYIAFTWSARTGDPEDGQYIKSGVKIVHVADKSVVANKEVKNINGGLGTFGNFVIAGTNNYRNNGIYVTKQLFFDLQRKKMYTRELAVDCLGKAKMMGDGILMQCLDGTSYKLLFSKDFIVEDML